MEEQINDIKLKRENGPSNCLSVSFKTLDKGLEVLRVIL
jgi:hypothetical protein